MNATLPSRSVDLSTTLRDAAAKRACGLGSAVFEPNPLAYRLLVQNVVMNNLSDRIAFDFIGGGDIGTVRPDCVLPDERPDVIKIDVEGMEMEVLRGLQKTIRRCRPVLLVECDRENIHDFADWRLANGFELPTSVKHYPTNRNFLCIPEERMGDVA